MTGTAIEFPIALYRGPSGQSSADLFRHGMRVRRAVACSCRVGSGSCAETAKASKAGRVMMYAFMVLVPFGLLWGYLTTHALKRCACHT
jgi:hypothetical protein